MHIVYKHAASGRAIRPKISGRGYERSHMHIVYKHAASGRAIKTKNDLWDVSLIVARNVSSGRIMKLASSMHENFSHVSLIMVVKQEPTVS